MKMVEKLTACIPQLSYGFFKLEVRNMCKRPGFAQKSTYRTKDIDEIGNLNNL